MRNCAVAVNQFANFKGNWDDIDDRDENRPRRLLRNDSTWRIARAVSYEPSIRKPNLEEWESRSESPSITEGISSGAWIAANSKELSERYAGRWVLVVQSILVADASKPTDLQKIVLERKIKDPMIFKVTSPSTKGAARAVYGGQVLRDRNSIS